MVKEVLLAYVPVPHAGYSEFVRRHLDATALYVWGEELIVEFPHLAKDIRALTPQEAKMALEALAPDGWLFYGQIRIATKEVLETLRVRRSPVVAPDDDESRELAAKYLGGCAVTFERVFLRWDRTKSLAPNEVAYDRSVSAEGLVGEMMARAFAEVPRAGNWWRQVGAVIAREGEILLGGHNTQVPTPHIPYIEGDVRGFFSRGVHFDLTTDQHAESVLVSQAARRGIALEGADLYVTTFPCAPCAKLVAYAGIRRVFFSEGYSMLDAERVLKANGVEIIYVERMGE